MIKALSTVEIGNKTYKAGEVVIGLSESDFKWMKEAGFVEGDLPKETKAKPEKKKAGAKNDVSGDVKD